MFPFLVQNKKIFVTRKNRFVSTSLQAIAARSLRHLTDIVRDIVSSVDGKRKTQLSLSKQLCSEALKPMFSAFVNIFCF